MWCWCNYTLDPPYIRRVASHSRYTSRLPGVHVVEYSYTSTEDVEKESRIQIALL